MTTTRAMARLALVVAVLTLSAPVLAGQEPPKGDGERPEGLIEREKPPAEAIVLPRGTRVPLVLINSVSSKNAAPGDKLYLQSVYPVAVNGRILVPPGTYVSGTVTDTKRPGRVKGKGQIRLQFEQMILPNGTIREFVGSLGSLDGGSEESLDRESGTVESAGTKGEDAQAVADAARVGSTVGVIAGAAGGSPWRGLGLGGAAGAAAGLAGVLLTRGPDALLERGTQLDMVFDRDLFFTEQEVSFDDPLGRPTTIPVRGQSSGEQGNQQGGGILGLPTL